MAHGLTSYMQGDKKNGEHACMLCIDLVSSLAMSDRGIHTDVECSIDETQVVR